jgi:hypothetical protein
VSNAKVGAALPFASASKGAEVNCARRTRLVTETGANCPPASNARILLA